MEGGEESGGVVRGEEGAEGREREERMERGGEQVKRRRE